MSPDEVLAAVARRHFGVFTHVQARDAGLTDGAIRHRRRTGRWDDLFRGVYKIPGAPTTREGTVLAAVLAFGPYAAASHTDAAWLLRVSAEPLGPVHVVRQHGQNRAVRAGVVFHQAALGERDVRRVGVIPVTCPNRTLVDLAAILPRASLEASVDEALLSGLTTALRVRAFIVERELRHRPGVGVLFDLLSDRCEGGLQRELERMFLSKVKRSPLPLPRSRVHVGRRRLDFAYPDAMIAIELDGRNPHSSGAVFRDDRRRQNELVLAGWLPLRFTWFDVDEDWRTVERTLAALLGSRTRVG